MQKPLPPARVSPKSPMMVWLLNLIPFAHAGLIYAMGPRCFVLLLFVWFTEISVPRFATYVIWYFVLSIVGVGQLNSQADDSKPFARLPKGDDVVSPDRGTQIPLAKDAAFYQARHDAKMAKRAHGHADDDQSDHATDLFEAKAHAAELQLKARAEQSSHGSDASASSVSATTTTSNSDSNPNSDPDEMDFRPTDAPTFSDETPGQLTQDVPAPTVSDFLKAPITVPDLSTTGASSSASASAPFGSALPAMDMSADTPSVVPEIASMLASSESAIPDVTSQYSTEPLQLPKSDMQIASDSVPSSANANSAEFSKQVAVDSTVTVPDVTSQFDSATIALPTDASIVSEPSSSPSFDFSNQNLGNFEIPKFDFSFQDPLQSAHTDASAVTPAASATTDASSHCPKCNAEKNSNFSFCLTCGQTFL